MLLTVALPPTAVPVGPNVYGGKPDDTNDATLPVKELFTQSLTAVFPAIGDETVTLTRTVPTQLLLSVT